MESIGQIFSGLTLLVLAVGAGAFIISISIAGLLYVTAFGDPQKISMAKGALMSSLLGILIMAFAPLAPRVLNQVVFEPAGLGSVVQDSGGCDATLRTALITQRSVNTARAANVIIRQLQAQRSDDCSPDLWDPEVRTNDGASTPNDAGFTTACGAETASTEPPDDLTIGGTDLPSSLARVVWTRSDVTTTPATVTNFGAFARDNDGNMLMEFVSASRPTDGSQCWIYNTRGNFWDEQA